MVPVSPASPPRVSVHCHPGTPLGSPRNWRRAAASLFPTMSLLLGGPSGGGGGGEGGAPAPCLWRRPFSQQCMLGSELCPWACMGMLQRCPLTRRPPVPNAATALLPLVTQPVSVQSPEGHSQDSTWFSCLWEQREGGQSPLSCGWQSTCLCGGDPTVVRPRGQRKESPHFQQSPWGHRASPCIWLILTEHQCARPSASLVELTF